MNQTGKKCFIITPIGNTDSEIFRKTKGVIDSVIKPVLQKYEFSDIKPAYEITEQGTIGNQIISRIIGDDLVVVNLTGNNPNVMYELAVRHVTAKPIVTICENGTVLPFDIKDSRTIFYKDDMLGTQELKNAFESFVAGIDYSICYQDNPIYNAVNSFSGISIPNEKQSVKLSFSLTTNGERLEDGVCPTKTSPSGYSIKVYNISEKPFYLEAFSLEYAEKTIVDCVLPEETAIAPYEKYEYKLGWQEYDAILYHCREAILKKCDVVAYEVGGRKFSGEIDLVLPHLQSNFRTL